MGRNGLGCSGPRAFVTNGNVHLRNRQRVLRRYPGGPDPRGRELPPGIGPYKLACAAAEAQPRRARVRGLFLLIVVLCLFAPVYSQTSRIPSRTGTPPARSQATRASTSWHHGYPDRATWDFHHYFLGADGNGRDVAVRLLYGGRNSLEIGGRHVITMVLALILGIAPGYFRGLTDGVINRILDVIWAFPAVLLGVTLGTVLATGGIGPLNRGRRCCVPGRDRDRLHPVCRQAGPRSGADVARAGVRRRRSSAGPQPLRIMFSEILPNLASTIIVFIPLILANAILLEAGLTYWAPACSRRIRRGAR